MVFMSAPSGFNGRTIVFGWFIDLSSKKPHKILENLMRLYSEDSRNSVRLYMGSVGKRKSQVRYVYMGIPIVE